MHTRQPRGHTCWAGSGVPSRHAPPRATAWESTTCLASHIAACKSTFACMCRRSHALLRPARRAADMLNILHKQGPCRGLMFAARWSMSRCTGRQLLRNQLKHVQRKAGLSVHIICSICEKEDRGKEDKTGTYATDCRYRIRQECMYGPGIGQWLSEMHAMSTGQAWRKCRT